MSNSTPPPSRLCALCVLRDLDGSSEVFPPDMESAKLR